MLFRKSKSKTNLQRLHSRVVELFILGGAAVPRPILRHAGSLYLPPT
jgi:hypothetical protein